MSWGRDYSEAERARILAEYQALPRIASGRVLSGYLGLLSRKWGASKDVLVRIVKQEKSKRAVQIESDNVKNGG